MVRLTIRLGAALLLIAAAMLVHVATARHLESAGPLPSMPLIKPLEDLPMEIGDWQGQELPVTDERLQYGDEYHQRYYVHRETQQPVYVWMVYAADGEDRGHHPEVCMAVAGKPEDASVRQTLEAPGHEQPIQQYRFGSAGDVVWVFYWHYTLVPPPDESLSELQRLYQRLRRRPSSVTLEVFAPATATTDVEAVQQFVVALDAAVQEHVGPEARRDSTRSPVTLTDVDPGRDS